MTDSGKVEDTAKAVKGIAEAVPIYQDLAQPAVRELGKGLHTAAKTIHIVLAPVKALVWGYEQLEDFLSSKVAEKLSETPQDEIVGPKPHVAGPALEALRYAGHEEALRELYANLLAASMDIKTASMAHPSFVEIIKQLTPDEARLLSHFASAHRLPIITVWTDMREPGQGGVEVLVNFSLFGRDAQCEHSHLTPSYLDNLARLGLIEMPDSHYTAPGAYDELENHPTVTEVKNQVANMEDRNARIDRGLIQITQLGRQFIKACVLDHREI